MTAIPRLELARHRTARPVDHLDSPAAHDREAEAMTSTAVDVTAELSRVDAARACDVSVDTIKRRQKAGSFPNARQVGLDRSWVIPVRDLVDAGLLPAAALALPAQPAHLESPAARAIIVGSGAVEALDACARGDVDFFGSGRGRWVGADAFALVDGSGVVALGLGVDAGGVAEGIGVGIFVAKAPARGFAVADVSDGAGNVIAESPKAPAGEVVVGEAFGWSAPAVTLDPMTPTTPRTVPPARHVPTAMASVRGVSCMIRPPSRPRSSGSL